MRKVRRTVGRTSVLILGLMIKTEEHEQKQEHKKNKKKHKDYSYLIFTRNHCDIRGIQRENVRKILEISFSAFLDCFRAI